MKVFIIGSMKVGSQVYSQCLRDVLRLSSAVKKQGRDISFLTDNSQAGILATKLIKNAQLPVSTLETDYALARADVVLVYVEDPEVDMHYRDFVYDNQKQETEVYMRVTPPVRNNLPSVEQPPADPYAEFKKAFTLIEKRIRPIPTHGPQVWREIELRPNNGAPWFNI